MQINSWLLWFRTLGTSFSRAPEDHGLHETSVLAHDELAGAPLYTLNIHVVPHPQYSHCHPPGVVQTFHSVLRQRWTRAALLSPHSPRAPVLLGCLYEGMVNTGESTTHFPQTRNVKQCLCVPIVFLTRGISFVVTVTYKVAL